MFRRLLFIGDFLLIILISISLVVYKVAEGVFPLYALIGLNIAAFIPLLVSAGNYALKRRISVELLAVIALFASMAYGEWFSAGFINLMLASARVFQRYTEDRGRKAIESLAKMRPEKALVRRDGKGVSISVESIAIGDELIIGAGEGVPADGTIVEGEGDMDESSITGESVPVEKRLGDMAMGGTVLLSEGLSLKRKRSVKIPL